MGARFFRATPRRSDAAQAMQARSPEGSRTSTPMKQARTSSGTAGSSLLGRYRKASSASPTRFVTSSCLEQNACCGDIDEDGDIDVNDLVQVILGWGDVGDVPGDVNGDGEVDIDDLIILFLAWGPCP